MSLAYKLWKIGSVLTEDDMKGVVRIDPATLLKPGEEPDYLNLDFTIDAGGDISLALVRSAVSKDRMFFTKKRGGSGSGIYYLYPNLVLRLTDRKSPASKLPLLVNTIEKSMLELTGRENLDAVRSVLDFLKANPDHKALAALGEMKGGIFWFWISINGMTLPDLIPEVWQNWFKRPVNRLKEARPGYDSFTGQETIVGFRTEFRVFSYDQYHDSLNHRVRDNLPLSLESAARIKLAWIYVLERLVFYYKGLEYIILPNLLMEDPEALRTILHRLETANAVTKGKPQKLKDLRKKEKRLVTQLDKLCRRQRGARGRSGEDIRKLQAEQEEKASEIHTLDTGLITEFQEQAAHLGDLKNAVTLDFIFTAINRTNLSFEIKGAIDDLIPSRLSRVVDLMRTEKIQDNITLTDKKSNQTYLQDYFSREELSFVLSKTQKQNQNRLLQERLYLARLLLTDTTISMDNLLARFQFHREFDYARKQRITDGIKDWINFSGTYVPHESKIILFFQTLNKLKETLPCPEKKVRSTTIS